MTARKPRDEEAKRRREDRKENEQRGYSPTDLANIESIPLPGVKLDPLPNEGSFWHDNGKIMVIWDR